MGANESSLPRGDGWSAALVERLPGIVMAWTMVFMTFTWTPTMRALLKPEISRWQVFEWGGSGLSLEFLLIPLLAVYGLFLFYLYGRGRKRLLFHAMLLILHAGISLTFLIPAALHGSEARFIGAAWGFDVSLAVLSIPFSFFTGLGVWWCVAEARGQLSHQPAGWLQVDRRKLVAAVLMLPLAMIFFGVGENYDGWTKLAIAVTILQWITLAEALSHPRRS